jgi:prevent-host-death family protein
MQEQAMKIIGHVSLRDANQHLSRYVTAVEQGQEFVITRRGRPVAKLVPVEARRELSEEQRAALERIRERMRAGYDLGGERIKRDDIYDR